jgi:hypothetical protein
MRETGYTVHVETMLGWRHMLLYMEAKGAKVDDLRAKCGETQKEASKYNFQEVESDRN